MAFNNNMSDLLDKIERRLGTRHLNLPKDISKSNWGKIVIKDTLSTFSRYYPFRMTYILNEKNKGKDGYYYIDEADLGGDVEILGVKDVAFDLIREDSTGQYAASSYGIYDALMGSYSIEDLVFQKMRQDMMSMYNSNSTFVDFEYPNKIAIKTIVGNNSVVGIKDYPIYLFVKHSASLTTIAPTKMETFENLAQADIARFLYGELKMYDGLETVFAGNIDVKLDDLRTEADKRDEIINKLEDSYVSSSNQYQPMMYCF